MPLNVAILKEVAASWYAKQIKKVPCENESCEDCQNIDAMAKSSHIREITKTFMLRQPSVAEVILTGIYIGIAYQKAITPIVFKDSKKEKDHEIHSGNNPHASR